jgi:metal transporter CNNM
MSAPVLVLMYLMAPVAWPTAKLLDRLLGTDHGTTYKKAGLKTLVTLHKTLGEAGEQLNEDEVTIISAVLDLKDKPVGAIMTPMDDVFTMSANTILDENTMDIILSAGYSRIPIHAPDNPQNFIGMLLVKMLITYDPEDCKAVRDFALATLPETRPETSCLDIVNYFQEGKSHMVLVTDFPGEDCGALGVVTLEDVIEELIGEEIIDESDVFVDVHKAIRRLTPAPWHRVPRGAVIDHPTDTEEAMAPNETNGAANVARAPNPLRRLISAEGVTQTTTPPLTRSRKTSTGELSRSPLATITLRRTSSIAGQSDGDFVTKRTDAPELRDHLKHLGPSNLASRPKSTRYASVKIKPAAGAAQPPTSYTIVDSETAANTAANATSGANAAGAASTAGSDAITHPTPAAGGGVGEGLLSSAGMAAKDGVIAVQQGQGYGTMSSPPQPGMAPTTDFESSAIEEEPSLSQQTQSTGVQVDIPPLSAPPVPSPRGSQPGVRREHSYGRSYPHHSHHSRQSSSGIGNPYLQPSDSNPNLPHTGRSNPGSQAQSSTHLPAHGYYGHSSSRHGSRHHSRTHSASTLDSLHSGDSNGHARERDQRALSSALRRPVRSGSITENIVESGGFRKVVLELSSSESSEADKTSPGEERDRGKKDHDGGNPYGEGSGNGRDGASGGSTRRNKRNKRKSGRKGESRDNGNGGEEGSPLLGRRS